jgi:hypothetical protein
LNKLNVIILLTITLSILGFSVQRVIAPGVPFNVYGYVRDDLGNVIAGASVTVKSPIDQASTTTNSEGKYAVTISINGPGDQIQVTATYGSRSGSASGTVPSGTSSMQIDVTVPRISTSISCSVSPSTLTIGGSVTVSGAISPTVAGVTVTLTYTKPDGSTFTHSVTTSSSGTYSDTYTPDKIGTYSVQASWAGNNDYKGATSDKVSFTVTKKPSSISISLSSNNLIVGEKVEISGSISPPISGASVTISYRSVGGSWSSITTVSTDSSGRYFYSWTNTPPPGNYEVMASWPGNEEYNGASATASLTVIKPDFQINLDKSIIQLTIGGSSEKVTIVLSSIGGFSSTISLNLKNIPSGVQATLQKSSLDLPPNGQVSTTLELYASWSSTPGSYSMRIEASGGGLTHEATLNINIVLPPPSFNLILDKDSLLLPILKGYNSTVTVTITSKTNYSITVNLDAKGLPSGVKLSFENKLEINKLSSNSTTLTFTIIEPLPAKGNYSLTITGSCSGVKVNTTLTLQIIEKIPSKIMAFLNASTLKYGEVIELKGSISPAPQKSTKAYIYLLFGNNTRIKVGETNVNEQGQFSFIYPPVEVGEYTILIEWSGTELYLGSSLSATISVSKALTIITLKTNATEAYLGKTILVSGKLKTEKGEPIPNMNVNIIIRYKGLTFYSTVTTNSTGDYCLPLNLAEGKYEVSASTLGNKYYAASSSNTIILTVVKEPQPPITVRDISFLFGGLVIGIAIIIAINKLRKS